MRWSWKIGKLAGIDLYVHATFFLLILWVAIVYWVGGHSLAAVVNGVVFILVLFACIVAHEFGHALTARRYGIPTRDITLLPIGGLSRLERMPDKPWQEFWVALAGPAINVALAILLYIWILVSHGWIPITKLRISEGPFVERILIANLFLVLFNLIPAFPMDGGRVLRALLATRMDYPRATRTAAGIGQALALVFGLLGLFFDPFLLFIALFVWIGAAQEASAVQVKDVFAGIPIRAAMQTDFRTLTTSDTLGDAVKVILDGSQHDFPVIWGDRVMGILTRSKLISGLATSGAEQRVTEAMERNFETGEPNEMLEAVLRRLSVATCRTMPILEDGRLIGLVTMENLGEYMMIQNALQKRTTRLPKAPFSTNAQENQESS
jgi:Zn-dependent protease/CBS domain-containing protein